MGTWRVVATGRRSKEDMSFLMEHVGLKLEVANISPVDDTEKKLLTLATRIFSIQIFPSLSEHEKVCI